MERSSLGRPVLSLLLLSCLLCALASGQSSSNEVEATQFLTDLDPDYLREANAQMKVRWQYITDVNDANSQAQVSYHVESSPAKEFLSLEYYWLF